VDVVIANRHGQLVGVDVKAAASVQAAQCAGMRRLATQAGERFLGGVILYDGIQTLPMGSIAGRPIWALPLPVYLTPHHRNDPQPLPVRPDRRLMVGAKSRHAQGEQCDLSEPHTTCFYAPS
jgi:hypothetical protein